MTNEKNTIEKSKLVAVAIIEGDITKLITPFAKYTLYKDRGIQSIESVEDYSTEVQDAIKEIADNASIPEILKDRNIYIQVRRQ